MDFASLTLTLFLIIDPVGNMVPISNLLNRVEPHRRLRVFLREMLIALAVMVGFYFFGDLLLNMLDVKPPALQMAMGLVLFLIAIRMIFPKEQPLSIAGTGEPWIVPIAIPMMAGPSVLATVMLYHTQHQNIQEAVLAIMIAWGLCSMIYFGFDRLHPQINPKLVTALERLLGLILTLLAVETFLKGLKLFIEQLGA